MRALIARGLGVGLAAIVGCGDSVSGTHETTMTTTTTTTEAPATDGAATTSATSHGSTGSGEPSIVEAYCACMLERCHDLYHATWGDDHVGSEAMCEAAAAAVPMVGMPATDGDSLECRLHRCEAAASDLAECDSAIGGGVCI